MLHTRAASTAMLCAIAALSALAGCTEDAPPTSGVEWDESCAETEMGAACITLHFTVMRSIRDDAEKWTGVLHWALYQDGDVGGLGPGDAVALYEGEIDADFSALDAEHFVTVSNAAARPYQVLSYLDADLDGIDSGGDPVTLPSAGFPIPPDQRTMVEVRLNYVE